MINHLLGWSRLIWFHPSTNLAGQTLLPKKGDRVWWAELFLLISIESKWHHWMWHYWPQICVYTANFIVICNMHVYHPLTPTCFDCTWFHPSWQRLTTVSSFCLTLCACLMLFANYPLLFSAAVTWFHTAILVIYSTWRQREVTPITRI